MLLSPESAHCTRGTVRHFQVVRATSHRGPGNAMTAMQMKAMRTARLCRFQSQTNRPVATLMYSIRGMDVRDAKSIPCMPVRTNRDPTAVAKRI